MDFKEQIKQQTAIAERRHKLQTVIDEYHQDAIRRIIPAFPYLLVRVLPRAHKVGGLYIPETAKKVLHEGLVLETYKPYWRPFRTRAWNAVTDEQEAAQITESYVMPPCNVGDHILFQWYEGVPVEHSLFKTAFVSEQTYILLAANPIGGGRNGVLGVVEDGIDIEKMLLDELCELNNLAVANGNNDVAKALMEKFMILPKEVKSITRSGVDA